MMGAIRKFEADHHVAARLKFARKLSKININEVADKLGMTHQQIYKYEAGTNRVSAGRLYHFSQLYGLPISWFFEGLENTHASSSVPTPFDEACFGAKLITSALSRMQASGAANV